MTFTKLQGQVPTRQNESNYWLHGFSAGSDGRSFFWHLRCRHSSQIGGDRASYHPHNIQASQQSPVTSNRTWTYDLQCFKLMDVHYPGFFKATASIRWYSWRHDCDYDTKQYPSTFTHTYSVGPDRSEVVSKDAGGQSHTAYEQDLGQGHTHWKGGLCLWTVLRTSCRTTCCQYCVWCSRTTRNRFGPYLEKQITVVWADKLSDYFA